MNLFFNERYRFASIFNWQFFYLQLQICKCQLLRILHIKIKQLLNGWQLPVIISYSAFYPLLNNINFPVKW